MNDTIRVLYRTVKAAIWGEPVEGAAMPQETAVQPTIVPAPSSTPEIPKAPLIESPDLIPAQEPDPPVPGITMESATVSDEWTVRTMVDPVFVKIGRVYLDAGDLIIRSDRDSRGFLLSEDDIDAALTGGSGTVRLLDLTAAVGTAQLSTSGRALNIGIDQQVHTIPLRLLTPVLTGHNRKAPLFVPKEAVAPD
ncbi:MAG: hypothetical protein WC295_06125 [Methanoregula sp.]|jgi:hypothetical protein